MKLNNLDGSPLMDVTSLKRDGNNIIIKGTILGSMPITCMLTPTEGRGVFRLMDVRTLLFAITFLFRP